MTAGTQIDRLAAVANGFSIHKDIGLFWTDVNFQFSCRWTALGESGSETQREERRYEQRELQGDFDFHDFVLLSKFKPSTCHFAIGPSGEYIVNRYSEKRRGSRGCPPLRPCSP